MNRILHRIVFVVGLAAVCWAGAGYIGANPLALLITVLIGAFYLVGALELHRFDQATASLDRAVADMPQAPASLGQWLEQLHPTLRNAVRLRIEGERVGLPGPALTPYLAGLLVLLGMLGTFLGMVVTLNGTGTALEHATDLQAMRASLAAPVKGLGVAFGTSLAGVAASAMLGLVSALCRRDRLQAAQRLDTRIATTLRGFSLAHHREESFKLLQRQGEAVPVLVERLQQMMETMERQSQALHERLVASQDGFHDKAQTVYADLASSVGQSLKEGLGESARIAGATLQPVVEATMAGIARETAALHKTVEQGVQRQLDGLSARFETTVGTVAGLWQAALDGQQRTNEAQADGLRTALAQFTQSFEERSASLVDGVSGRLETMVERVSDHWRNALEQQERAGEKLAGTTQGALTAAAASFEQHSASLLGAVGQAHTELQAGIASRDQERLAAWTRSLEAMAASLQQEWQQAGVRAEAQQQEICRTLAQTATEVSAQAEAQARGTLAEIGQFAARNDSQQQEIVRTLTQAATEISAQAEAQARGTLAEIGQFAARNDSQQQEIVRTLAQAATEISAQAEAQARGTIAEIGQLVARNESQQQEIVRTLAQTATAISAQAEAHARGTLAEIGQLMQAAAEAPRAAAEVIAELRQKLSDSMTRDNAMLEERSRILGTLETLLDAVNHASTEQRSAIDALVGASADLLDRVGARFTDKVDAETAKMGDVAAQITGGAVEVASLGEAFGTAVQLFAESNDRMGAQLQRIEAALGKSLARSDEQLSYYVAQAREVVDLSILSQKQIVEDLQHLASQRTAAVAASEAA